MVGEVLGVIVQAQRIHHGLSCFARRALGKHGQHDAGTIRRNGQVATARLQRFEQAESELGTGGVEVSAEVACWAIRVLVDAAEKKWKAYKGSGQLYRNFLNSHCGNGQIGRSRTYRPTSCPQRLMKLVRS